MGRYQKGRRTGKPSNFGASMSKFDIDVCLQCPYKKCYGKQECWEKRREEVLKNNESGVDRISNGT